MSIASLSPASISLSVGSRRSASSTASTRAAVQRFKHSKSTSAARVSTTTRCVSESKKDESSRRDLMLSSAGMLAMTAFPAFPALADEAELIRFYGAANPPATPGRLGGVAKSKARYSFVYPSTWVEDVVTKVEKGTYGTDVRLTGPKFKKEKLFVLTLLNFGGKTGFTIEQPPEPLLFSLTGSLYTFQDALADGELTTSTVYKDGKKYYEYRLDGPESFLIRLTVDDGRVFGLFLSATAKAFASDAAMFRTMIDSFESYANVPGADDRA